MLEAYHGWPGTAKSWLSSMQLPGRIDAAVAAHTLAESIVVIPALNSPSSVDTECVNGPTGSPQMETWLATDVPAFIIDHFRVLRERSAWATIGFSTGGWCAAMMAMLHPDHIGASITLGGYFSPQFLRSYTPFTAQSVAGKRYNLTVLAGSHPPPVAMWIQTGGLDHFRRQTLTFLAAVRPPTAATEVLVPGVGHRTSVWVAQLDPAFAWLGRTAPGFAA